MALLQRIFGTTESRTVKSWLPIVQKINSLESDLSSLGDADLSSKTLELKMRVKGGESLDDVLPEAFALVREASKRTLGQRHFDVQLLGGIAIHKGGIAEMRTGEGKTLVATLPVYLNALEGDGVHVVTVNDYLSRRDAVWMGQIYEMLGMSVGVLNHDSSYIYDKKHTEIDKLRDEVGAFHVVHEFLKPVSKSDAYKADITYGTNNEFGFDYLRDNLVYDKNSLSQRGFKYAVVDEIDSILIDEARTPLIISAPTKEASDLYVQFAKIARELEPETDFTVDEKRQTISMTGEGINKAEKILGMENIYSEGGVRFVHHLETAVRAKALFHIDKKYVVKDGEIVIVDEFTGRLQPGRRWSEGLHQAIEAKEGVRIKEESRTFASITFQNYFRMYQKISGMTGTASTSKEEFYKVYGLETYEIPTNKSVDRKDQNDLIFQTEKGKYKAVTRKVKELYDKGQPVLIGTVSIENNEVLSDYLNKSGIPHEILNAKNHEREGEIIAQAGKRSAVTIATNMAGRGVDIKLGGNPSTKESYEEVKSLGGLFVLGTERHDARRIDNQLRGRSGRQGDPGETQFFVSLEDSLMRIFATDTIKNMMGRFKIAEDEPIENKLITNALEKAQERIEGFNFDARRHVLEFDDVLNHQRSHIYEDRKSILVGDNTSVYTYLKDRSDTLEESTKERFLKKLDFFDTKENSIETLKRVILQSMDTFWVDHLEVMEHLRSSVNLRAYGQRDPLIEYKKEGLKYFKEMQASMIKQIAEFFISLDDAVEFNLPTSSIEKTAVALADIKKVVTDEHKDLGRNDPCWCGSGKKYKKCHGVDE